jgi:putative transposase
MSGSHTPAAARHHHDGDRRLQLVSTAERGLPAELAGAIDGHLATFAAHVREGLLAASTAVGLEVMAEMMQAEVTELAGPKGRHNPQRSHTRHGTEHGTVTLGGRRLPVTRPRVRTVGDEPAEATLASYAMFAATDLLTEQVTARMLAGISTRTYPVALEPVGEAVEAAGRSTSKSAVSRRFVAATAERLAELCARPLGDRRWPIVMLDGVHLGEHLLVVALGVTDDGTKVPLGVVEGSTENAAVCARLVADLVDRGLDAERGILFVIDGGKALAKAIRAAFGSKALIQRCRRHKERNVVGHLPEGERPLIQRKLRTAWANPDPDAALRELEALARALDKKRPGAACVAARRPRRHAHRQPARRERLAAQDRRVNQPRRVHDRDRPPPRPEGEALAARRDGAALDRRRDARRRGPVPPRQGLPAAPAAAGRSRRSDR